MVVATAIGLGRPVIATGDPDDLSALAANHPKSPRCSTWSRRTVPMWCSPRMAASFLESVTMSRPVELPIDIMWSGPRRTYDLDDPKDRSTVYELVLQEGDGDHVRTYVDVDDLYARWDTLYLPAGVETAWADYFERVRGTPVRRRWASPDSNGA